MFDKKSMCNFILYSVNSGRNNPKVKTYFKCCIIINFSFYKKSPTVNTFAVYLLCVLPWHFSNCSNLQTMQKCHVWYKSTIYICFSKTMNNKQIWNWEFRKYLTMKNKLK